MAFIANECFLQAPPASLLKILRIYNKAAIDVCAGQQLDIDFEKAAIISHEEYLTMIELKTARLLAASAKIGSVIGGAAERETELMYEFGKSLGLAFQVQDDLLDTYGDTKVFGKVPGGDIIANKKTFLLVKALEIASAPQLKTLQELFSGKEYEPEIKVQKVMDLYDQLNIRSITEDLATNYFNYSFSMLEKTGVAKDRKEELEMLAASLIDRKK
jgi:geranylgeranyl diphosphate synthase type II